MPKTDQKFEKLTSDEEIGLSPKQPKESMEDLRKKISNRRVTSFNETQY